MEGMNPITSPDYQLGKPTAEIPQPLDLSHPEQLVVKPEGGSEQPGQGGVGTAAAQATGGLASSPVPSHPIPAAGSPNPTTSSSYDSPMIADDVDVIEKEWVDLAQAEIKRTAGDPYAEEEAIEALQIQYLKQRYGKEIKPAGGA